MEKINPDLFHDSHRCTMDSFKAVFIQRLCGRIGIDRLCPGQLFNHTNLGDLDTPGSPTAAPG
jgi:hypothetical protein